MMSERPHPTDAALNEFLDETLLPSAHVAVADHLRACPHCQERLKQLEAVFVSLDELPEVSLDRDLTSGVLVGIQAPVKRWQTARWAFWIQVGLASLILALTWPSLGSWLESLPWQLKPSSFFDLLEGWGVAVQNGTADLTLRVEGFWRNLQTAWAQPIDLPWPDSLAEIWPLVGVLGLLWLLVNGAILSPWISGAPKRAS